ncbi:uncharacterized protein GGS25DRAFT_453086 [Hypoxylon fragiforme]|uniref:uncharacterized protein n=1 Tax=Hypoxylon fragiforme TaxID=63214 RepID=UPI0020C69348|nr:uncharacterized protein GGS25DRAFT_453086 [Hypoxylon fragiforme]KAI2604252.1 hypothetical protein GGS25DRAFT_453086 [Hypoxylon fragiforme]
MQERANPGLLSSTCCLTCFVSFYLVIVTVIPHYLSALSVSTRPRSINHSPSSSLPTTSRTVAEHWSTPQHRTKDPAVHISQPYDFPRREFRLFRAISSGVGSVIIGSTYYVRSAMSVSYPTYVG